MLRLPSDFPVRPDDKTTMASMRDMAREIEKIKVECSTIREQLQSSDLSNHRERTVVWKVCHFHCAI